MNPGEREPGFQQDCPGCLAQRVHTDEETLRYHPWSKHGYTKEQGYTHPSLEQLAKKREELKKLAIVPIKK